MLTEIKIDQSQNGMKPAVKKKDQLALSVAFVCQYWDAAWSAPGDPHAPTPPSASKTHRI